MLSTKIDEHMKVHNPCRNWCSHCVWGKLKPADHRRQAQSGPFQSSTWTTCLWVARTRTLRRTPKLRPYWASKRFHRQESCGFHGRDGLWQQRSVVHDGPGTVHRRPCEQAQGSPSWHHNLHRKLRCGTSASNGVMESGGLGGHDPCLERCARSQVVCQTRFESQHNLLDRRVRSSLVEQVRGGSRRQDWLRTHSR